jgi:hypothetical protein
MTEQQIQPKPNKPIIGLILSLSSTFLCCISIGITPQNGEAVPMNSVLWILSQVLMCVAVILPLVGAILGFMSLQKNEANRQLAIAALIIGILSFITTAAILAFNLFFAGLAYAWLQSMP